MSEALRAAMQQRWEGEGGVGMSVFRRVTPPVTAWFLKGRELKNITERERERES